MGTDAMMDSSNEQKTVTLTFSGIDGGNPLGFLATLGTLGLVIRKWPETQLFWQALEGCWRPTLTGCSVDADTFLDNLYKALMAASNEAFSLSRKLPFNATEFKQGLIEAQSKCSATHRRTCDFLAAFGTEMYPDDKTGMFQDSKFRMVRSGDSAGQGLPVYAEHIRKSTTIEHLRRTLFHDWDYQDLGFNLRWDPIDDQRYALRWRDPSKSNLNDGPGTMIGANSLAIEALQYFPTFIAKGNTASTTAFYRSKRREVFMTWPIWTVPLDIQCIKSLLSHPAIIDEEIKREELNAAGIAEVYRSQRIQQNQYYSNFAPAYPV